MQDGDHLLGALRYVERNALRAESVAGAEDWKWSSLPGSVVMRFSGGASWCSVTNDGRNGLMTRVGGRPATAQTIGRAMPALWRGIPGEGDGPTIGGGIDPSVAGATAKDGVNSACPVFALIATMHRRATVDKSLLSC